MKITLLKKKIAAGLAAATFTLTLGTAVPQAEASVLGAVLGGISAGAQAIQARNQLKHYDTDQREEFFQAMKEHYGVNEDEELNARLDYLMAGLTEGIGRIDPTVYDKPYNYFINNETTFNAFCSVGHNMSINTGLFNLVDNDDEIAVVIGHEMAHGQKDHVMKGLNKKIPVIIAAGAASGGSVGVALGGALAANIIDATSITKPQEWEADNLAFDYMINSRFNPGACAAIWQHVIDAYGTQSKNFVGEIFSPSDHPSHEARRDNYNKKVLEYSGNHVEVTDGVVMVNKKEFVRPAATETASGAERAYLIAGRLARIYAGGGSNSYASLEDNTIYFGGQVIMECTENDPDASALTNLLNTIR